jgi:SAM-dependent methyltransferase
VRVSVRELVAIATETLPLPEPVCEFGSFQVPGQEEVADLRPLFPRSTYVGFDMRPGKGVDAVVDLHAAGVKDHFAGTILSLDTFEHVEHPREAIAEIRRVLAPEGVFILTSVMNFPIHEYPYDYWRFTPEAFRSLLRDFKFAYVDYAGTDDFPHLVFAVASDRALPDSAMQAFRSRIAAFQQKWRDDSYGRPSPGSWRYWARELTPPLVYKLYRKVRFND